MYSRRISHGTVRYQTDWNKRTCQELDNWTLLLPDDVDDDNDDEEDDDDV